MGALLQRSTSAQSRRREGEAPSEPRVTPSLRVSHHWQFRRGMIAVVMRLLCSIILAWLATGASTTRPTALTPAEVTALRASVVAADADRALDAIRKLNASGDPDARTAAAKLLDRDATMIRDDSAAAWGPYGALAKLRAAEAEAAPLRETAIAAAASLIKEPASRKAVRANYDRLQAIQTRLAGVMIKAATQAATTRATATRGGG